jgi:hypothetical protein
MPATFRIAQIGGEVTYYVSRSPDIRFTDKQDEALIQGQDETLDTMNVLMTMQRISSGKDASVFAIECVSKGPRK